MVGIDGGRSLGNRWLVLVAAALLLGLGCSSSDGSPGGSGDGAAVGDGAGSGSGDGGGGSGGDGSGAIGDGGGGKTGFTKTKTATSGRVVGHVLDLASHAALADVEISLGPSTTFKTKADGAFDLSASSGRALLIVRHPDYVEQRHEVGIGAAPLELEITLARRGPTQPVDDKAGKVGAGRAELTFPAGTFAPGSTVAATLLRGTDLAGAPGELTFSDGGSEIVTTAVLDVEVSSQPQKPVEIAIPTTCASTSTTRPPAG